MLRRSPGMFLLVCVVIAIVFSDLLRPDAWKILVFIAISCTTGLLLLMREKSRTAVLSLAAAVAGFAALGFSLQTYSTSFSHLSQFADGQTVYQIYARVSDWPELRKERTDIRLTIDSLGTTSFTHVDGDILLKVSDVTTAVQRGDRLEFLARLYPIPAATSAAGFSYGRYLALRGIHAVAYQPTLLDVRIDRRNRYAILNIVDGLRSVISSSLNRTLSPTSAALATGFLIGETRDIPEDIYRYFRDSGTLHLLAVSGSNVALVIIFILIIGRPFRLSTPSREILLLTAVVFFAFLSYLEPSVIRASVMAALVIMARLMDRRIELNNIIALAALGILLVNPGQLFDVGFQLSFVVAWSLIALVPKLLGPLQKYRHRVWYRWLVLPTLIALVAQVCSVPIIAFYFHRIPVLSVFANLLIVPAVSLGVMGILAVLVADLVLPMVGLFAGSILDLWMGGIIWLLELFGGERMPLVTLPPVSPMVVGAVYAAIVLAVYGITSKAARRGLLYLVLATANVTLAEACWSENDPVADLRLDLFTLPGGTAALVRQANGKEVDLIITGATHSDYPLDERIITPTLDIYQIDKVDRLFILGGDFAALGDFLQLAKKWRTDRIWISPGLQAGIVDNLMPFSGPYPEISLLNPARSSGQLGNCFRAQAAGLELRFGASSILFADRLRFDQIEVSSPEETRWLVLGRSWNSAPADLATLLSLGFDKVICSRVYHAKTVDLHKPGATSVTPADFIVNLRQTGAVTVFSRPQTLLLSR